MMRGETQTMDRPRNTKKIDVRISPRLLQRFDAALAQSGMTRADWVRAAILSFAEKTETGGNITDGTSETPGEVQ